MVDHTPRSGAEPSPDSVNAHANPHYLTPASAFTQSDMVARVFGSGSAWSDASPGPGLHYHPSPLAQVDDMEADDTDDIDAEVPNSGTEQHSTGVYERTTVESDGLMTSLGDGHSSREDTEVADGDRLVTYAELPEEAAQLDGVHDEVQEELRAMTLELTLDESNKEDPNTQPAQALAPEYTPPALSPITDVDLALPPPLIKTLPPLAAQNSNTEDAHTSLPSITRHDNSSHAGDAAPKMGLRKKLSLMASSLISSKRKDQRKISRHKSLEINEGIRGPAPTRATSTTSLPDPNPLAVGHSYQRKVTDTQNSIYRGDLRHYSSIEHYPPQHLEKENPRFSEDEMTPGARVKKAIDELDARLSLAVHTERKTWSYFNEINERKALRSESSMLGLI